MDAGRDLPADSARVGVLLVNTGSPDAPTEAAVRAYLSEFLMDDMIRPLPKPLWRLVLNHAILPRRAPVSASRYRSIWEDGSPLVNGCRRLAAAVEREAAARFGAGRVAVRAGMMYGLPSLAASLSELRAQGCERVLVAPLYPQTARSTTGAALQALRAAQDKAGWHPPLATVEGYGDDGGWQRAIADTVRAAGFDARRDCLLLSFHAVPLADVRRGDTYPEQVDRSVAGIVRELGAPEGAWARAFQSRFEDGRKWTGPFATAAVEKVARDGTRNLVVCCPGFSIDCLETRYDVEQVLRAAFFRNRPGAPDDAFAYVPCLGASAAHARALLNVMAPALGLR
ncbi:ferrochelatase [Collinsella intestinalis]|uniref:ferrochelatase n=1 Tax=Collinsella intestinalis TaxID=147207 RepID=UPI00195C5FD6|nr:ferrochelatase [Collinsella intestinalis]MBM6682568.1 ferrochelatase [Collinsella intestinalis]